MSNTLKDGGPAFPMSGDPNIDFDRGMSLRDYFAGQALAGMLASGDFDFKKMGALADAKSVDMGPARLAYPIADAMLAAREAQP